MSIVFFRRARLGHGSMYGVPNQNSRGIVRHLQEMNVNANVIRNDGKNYGVKRYIGALSNATLANADIVVRWGCTSRIDREQNQTILNTATAIEEVNNKLAFRRTLNDHPSLALHTYFHLNEITDDAFPLVVRRATHAQGRFLHVVFTPEELRNTVRRYGNGNWYATKLIQKTAEFRVAILQGRVLWVARKIPGDPTAVAWNVARGGAFENVNWGDWPLQAVRKSIEAFNLTSLDFGGVDIMVNQQDTSYVIEINSAPSLTSDYRQTCFAKGFQYGVNNGKERIPLTNQRGGWRKFIHPCMSEEAIVV